VNTAFPCAAIGKALDGVGERIEAAAGEKNSTTGEPSLVAKETVSPLATRTEEVLGMNIPPSWVSLMSVFAMPPKLTHFARAV
jgi:hypothetical protein